MVGLNWARRRQLREYSKGMTRRIGLAQALINDPELILLDEPTSGLDPIGTREMKDLILKLRDQGKTILMCSHLLADVQDVCDRIAILHQGELKELGRVDELLTVQDVTQLRAKGLSKEAEDEIRAVIARHGGELVGIEHPTLSLEELFLNIVRDSEARPGRQGGTKLEMTNDQEPNTEEPKSSCIGLQSICFGHLGSFGILNFVDTMALERGIPDFSTWLLGDPDIRRCSMPTTWGFLFGTLAICLLLFLIVPFICFVIASLQYGPSEAFYYVARSIFSAVTEDLPRFSPRRTFAVARLAVQEAIRNQMLVGFGIFLVLLLGRGHVSGRAATAIPARVYLSFVLTSTNYLVLLMALLLERVQPAQRHQEPHDLHGGDQAGSGQRDRARPDARLCRRRHGDARW